MANKYYGVKSPEKKIFTTWNDCKAYITGRKSVIFKSFETLEECESFVNDDQAELTPQKAYVAEHFNVDTAPLVSTPNFDTTKPLEAHVDGSFNDGEGIFGAGIVFVQGGKRVYEHYFSGIDHTGDWQVYGEVEAALSAIRTAIRFGFKEVVIWHDMVHLSAWPLGYFSTEKSPLGKRYADNIKNYEKEIAIKFVKESAHTGELFNERADRLAKKGCGLL